ncbi:MAG: dethiobiotin synthase, partial [Desulfovibrionales bacterium]|nr:dethiobiotin synthase [Desulfovibrionales bacterium]
MAGIFIAGTDTDVGKTMVTAALLRAFQVRGRGVKALKPLQSGGVPEGDGYQAPDVQVYQAAGGASAVLPPLHILPTPCSPHLAAALEGEDIDLQKMVFHCQKDHLPGEVLLVEGAGGIMTPLNKNETYLDLIQALDFPVV